MAPPVVLDASVLVVLTTADPRRPAAERIARTWAEEQRELHAPALLPFEVASALTRLQAVGRMSADQARAAWLIVLSTPITLHTLRDERVLEIAATLNRRSAYDAAYLAVAEAVNGELWTFDGPLSRNATSAGLAVNLIS